MGDVDEGDAKLALHAAQLLAHLDAQLLVERGQRLVEQQHARLGDRGARQRDALLLAAGKLRRQPIGEFGQPHLFHHGVGGLAAFGLGYAAHPQRKGDVVAYGKVRKQRVGLEHHRGAALRPAAGRRRSRRRSGSRPRSGPHVPRSCAGSWSCRSRRAEQTAIGAVGNLEIDAVDRVDEAVEALDDARQFDIAAIRLPCSPP